MYRHLYLQDVGGGTTGDGRRVRTGLLFRSNDLARLNALDRARLDRIGLRHIIDLREADAAARRPDRYAAEAVTSLPVRLGRYGNVSPVDLLLGKVDWRSLAALQDTWYAEVLEANPDLISRFLSLLAEDELPALVHCAAGKDRTGVLIAVLHLALGVPRDQIVQAYLAIEAHIDRHTSSLIKWLVGLAGVPRLAYTVEARYMERMLDHVGARYGTVERYLGRIRFTGLDRLRGRFLEEG